MPVTSRENSEHYKWGNDADGWHLLKSDSLSIIEESVPPNEREKRHYHEKSQQFFYVLSGIAHLEIAGEVFEVPANSGIHVPAGQPHQLINNGSGQLHFLLVSQPKSHGDRIDSP